MVIPPRVCTSRHRRDGNNPNNARCKGFVTGEQENSTLCIMVWVYPCLYVSLVYYDSIPIHK